MEGLTIGGLYRDERGSPCVAQGEDDLLVLVEVAHGPSWFRRSLLDWPRKLTPATPEDFPGVDFSLFNIVPHPPTYITEFKDLPAWYQDEEGDRVIAYFWGQTNSANVLNMRTGMCEKAREAKLVRRLPDRQYPIPGKDKPVDEDLPERVRVEGGAIYIGSQHVREIGTHFAALQIADRIRAGLREEGFSDGGGS